MKIALIGYGKMGHIIERIALERGHEIVSKVDVDNQEEFASEAFASADVAIEFTVPSKAVENYRKAWAVGVPVVSGTTGWNAVLPELKEEIAKKGYTLFWASNFSLGVNLFFELNKRLAQMMNRYANYDVAMTEIHHTEKKDAPSGTAITLAEGILENLDRKSEWVLVDSQQSTVNSQLGIEALREGKVPGTHIIKYDSEVDSITITHEAKSREGFALGAVVAAEFLVGKPAGFYSMTDLMNEE
jgi:4-hydroxy-tetrahydrodipicolinate reductase